MARLLHIKATPRSDDSRTMKLAAAFLEAYRKAHPEDLIETLDVFHDELPEFDDKAAAGKYQMMHGGPTTGEEAAWQHVVAAIEHFKSFDKYVISCPMWNFSIPYRLKLYIDTIVQPGLTFGYDPEKGYFGLAGSKPVQVLVTRGGDYSPESGAEAVDFQIPYLKFILGFIGLTPVRFIIAEPMDAVAPEEAHRILAAAVEQAYQAGAQF